MTTAPRGRQDEGREQMIEFLRSRIGQEAWLGICWPTDREVHGHRVWQIVALQSMREGVYVVLRLDVHCPTIQVNTDLIIRGAPDPRDGRWRSREEWR